MRYFQPALEPVQLPEHLQNIGSIDEETVQWYQRRARRRATTPISPLAESLCIPIPQPISVHSQLPSVSSTKDITLTVPFTDANAASLSSSISITQIHFSYLAGPSTLFTEHSQPSLSYQTP